MARPAVRTARTGPQSAVDCRKDKFDGTQIYTADLTRIGCVLVPCSMVAAIGALAVLAPGRL